MQQTLALKKEKTISVIKFIILLSLAALVPFVKNQLVVGPIVNATLFLSVLLLDIQSALLIGLIPSLISLSIGLLPPVLAPMIPFIMMGNSILIITFNFFKNKNFLLSVVISSILKFTFLYWTSSIVINLLLKKEISSTVATMMSWPQLYTALVGGMLAFGIFLVLKPKK